MIQETKDDHTCYIPNEFGKKKEQRKDAILVKIEPAKTYKHSGQQERNHIWNVIMEKELRGYDGSQGRQVQNKTHWE